MKKLVVFMSVLLACLFTTGCDFLFDEAHGYRGPIVVTIKTEDGSVPEFPFLIESGYSESCGHSSCGIEFGYKYFKAAYANEQITFPRERLDLLQPNAYASIEFTVTHPNYHQGVFPRGFPPTDADDPIYVTFTVKPFAEQMNKVAGWATGYKQDMQKFTPDSREFKEADMMYRQERFNLGQMIARHITLTKTVYLPHFSKRMQQRVIEKYQPIFKAWYYGVPETDCWDMVDCRKQILKPRKVEYEGL
ncbi:hypothetical protein MKZ42_19000 [Pseudoalteromonas shioyasakiensis]|uniref:Lipoprotein n=1 Tax=Pseudoalteromonas shioyasakiensis TaxID=1190813 RepID=A0ABT6U3N4_9GAMM|nr:MULTISPECIES: hypothetical protein [Pseudoalteromonas]MDI4670660.1 hypothetical protein [Pseudoalteromonas shioyasakiensis]MDI4675339.1 hypothetical protein [Pseudoalteromonas shioyasakiensis]MDI4687621.1 hypothetical protein [Pseudoalteromonas shioyasakiensis]MDI4706164.1 hypothetical protein [Pseudoalteromonas shioyasakiensis]